MRPQKIQAQACSTAGFLCKPQAWFFRSVREGQSVSRATHHRDRVGTNTWEHTWTCSNTYSVIWKPWEKQWVWGLQCLHPCLTKGLPYYQENLKQQEHEAWRVKCDPSPTEGSGHQSVCSGLPHLLQRAGQSLKIIWDATRKWNIDTLESQL